MAERTNFEQALGVIRRRWIWIALCCLLAAAAAFGLSKHQTKKYVATASLSFKSSQLAQQIAGLPVTEISTQSEQDSNVKLVKLGDMAEKTASRLGLTEKAVIESLSIAQQGETNVVGEASVVDISASSKSATLAAQIANTYAEQFVSDQQASNHHYFTAALADVNKQLAALDPKQRLTGAGVELENRAQELTLLSDLQYGGVQLAQRAAVPTAPESSSLARDTLIGLALGLLVGLGLAIALERLDKRLREPRELELVYGSPLLGTVPQAKHLARNAAPVPGAQADLPPTEAEAFSLIAAHLRAFNAGHEIRRVLITAAAEGAGATTVAFRLAQAAAGSGSRTLLLEADLRTPTLTQHAHLQHRPGLSDVLADAISFDHAVQSVELRGGAQSRSRESLALDVLVAGVSNVSSPGELLKSRAMQTLLHRVSSMYDMIVIDSPPLTVVSDAFPILHDVDGVVVVSELGRDRSDVAEQFRELLDRSAVPLLGVVANRCIYRPRAHARGDANRHNQPTVAAAAPQDLLSSTDETHSLART